MRPTAFKLLVALITTVLLSLSASGAAHADNGVGFGGHLAPA